MMKEIKLTKGYVTLVDDDDFEKLNQYLWHVTVKEHTSYAHRSIQPYSGSSIIGIPMHRQIMKAKSKDVIDHIDGDGLNNQKSNLRICSTKENNYNRRKQKNNTSGYRGVIKHHKSGKWRARIYHEHVMIDLGYYNTPEEAYRVYCEKAKELRGEFAKF